MTLHKITKGLNLPIVGDPEQIIEPGAAVKKVALIAADYVGMKPTMFVKEGDVVKRGQVLFEDKKMPGVKYTAPGAGTVSAVNRGDRRALLSVVIDLNDNEIRNQLSDDDTISYESFTGKAPAQLSKDEVRNLLIESGEWTSIRQRPFGRVANPEVNPFAIFVNVMDTNPHAPSVSLVLQDKKADFVKGLEAVSKLTDGKMFVCKAPETSLPDINISNVSIEEFDGPHPSGTVGLHMHTLAPVSRNRISWYLGYQEVIALGQLFTHGKIGFERIVSLAGPTVQKPRLLRTRLGASTDTLVENELEDVENRVLSGSVLSGRKAMGDVEGYLGRYHYQVTSLREGRDREFLGWLMPGAGKYSIVKAYISAWMRPKKYKLTTNTNGSKRAMVPIGMYEKIMPMDIYPTFLLRSLIMGDTEKAEQLGALELEEEDLALCTFVCPGKYEYGPILRRNLTEIEKEG